MKRAAPRRAALPLQASLLAAAGALLLSCATTSPADHASPADPDHPSRQEMSGEDVSRDSASDEKIEARRRDPSTEEVEPPPDLGNESRRLAAVRPEEAQLPEAAAPQLAAEFYPLSDLPSRQPKQGEGANVAPPWKAPQSYVPPVVTNVAALPVPHVAGPDPSSPKQEQTGDEAETREPIRRSSASSAKTAEPQTPESTSPEHRPQSTSSGEQEEQEEQEEPDEQEARQGGEPEPDRTVWAVPGEQIDLSFEGYGWIYRHTQSAGQEPKRRRTGVNEETTVSFRRRNYTDGNTQFLFDVNARGEQLLEFHREDAAQGSRSRRRIAVRVVSEEERARHIAEQDRQKDSPQGTESAVEGEKGKTELAAAGEDKEQQKIRELLDSARKGNLQPVKTARSLMQQGDERLAARLLEYRLQELSEGDYRRGEVLYLLGRLYEAPGPLRDERRAVDYYDRAVRGYPGSAYWRKAQERSNFLKRNYIHIR